MGDKVKSTDRRRLMMSDVSNPFVSDNQAFFRNWMDRTSTEFGPGRGPYFYETGFSIPIFVKDEKYDLALEGIIREAHHFANQAFDGKGGKVAFFGVNQKGCLSPSYAATYFDSQAKLDQLAEDRKTGPRMSFHVTVVNRTRSVEFKSELKTVQEWEQHSLPQKTGANDLHLMHAAMKPRRRLMMSDVSNPYAWYNKSYFVNYMDRTNGWGPTIQEKNFSGHVDYMPYYNDKALAGMIREVHHLANGAYDGEGGKVLYFQVIRKGRNKNCRWRPILCFSLIVGKTTEKGTLPHVTFRSEKTIEEWEQHRLPVKKSKSSPKNDLDQMFAAMKPTDKVKKSVQLRLMEKETKENC